MFEQDSDPQKVGRHITDEYPVRVDIPVLLEKVVKFLELGKRPWDSKEGAVISMEMVIMLTQTVAAH